MLTITVDGTQFWNEELEEFVNPESFTLQLEHSLVSLSKWESIFEKPFLGPNPKTNEELLQYIYIMILTPNVDPDVVHKLSEENFREISEYMERKMTATWFTELPNAPKSSELITAELIYHWMFSFNIPLDFENRHLGKLLTQIKVCNLKNSAPKKMSPAEAAAQQRELNARRRAQMGTRG